MSASETLKMIEEVSPDDTAKLDEIDARVWHWITKNDPNTIAIINLDILLKDFYRPNRNIPFYTRSRDALKAIRPEGYYSGGMPAEGKDGTFGFAGICTNKKEMFDTLLIQALPTEELAELHAIIQAIEYERTKS